MEQESAQCLGLPPVLDSLRRRRALPRAYVLSWLRRHAACWGSSGADTDLRTSKEIAARDSGRRQWGQGRAGGAARVRQITHLFNSQPQQRPLPKRGHPAVLLAIKSFYLIS